MKKRNTLALSFIIILSLVLPMFGTTVSAQNLSLTDLVGGDCYVSADVPRLPHVSWGLQKEDSNELVAVFDGRITDIVPADTEKGNPQYNLSLFVPFTGARSTTVCLYDGGYIAINEDTDHAELRAVTDYETVCRSLDKLLGTQVVGYGVQCPSKFQLLQISDWAEEPYRRALKKNLLPIILIDGYMSDNIHRELFCDLIFEFLKSASLPNENPTAENRFCDTRNEHVLYLVSQNIIMGKSDTIFAPHDFLTREEAATILSRVLTLLGADEDAAESDFVFADDADISDWAKESVYRLNRSGLLCGTGDNAFSPKHYFTKEQAIAVVQRISDELNIPAAETEAEFESEAETETKAESEAESESAAEAEVQTEAEDKAE